MSTAAATEMVRLSDLCAQQSRELRRMRDRIESLRGSLKSAAGHLYELGEPMLGDQALNAAGDMEPPL